MHDLSYEKHMEHSFGAAPECMHAVGALDLDRQVQQHP
jgi:hypothetical protein